MRTLSLLLLTSLLHAPLAAAEDKELAFEAASAVSMGKTLILDGDVRIDHALGNISAGHIMILSQPGAKKLTITTMEMQDDVSFDIRGGGRLHCQNAQLDCEGLTGRFCGSEKAPQVVYSETCPLKGDAKKKEMPLVIKGGRMDLQLASQAATEGKAPRNYVKEVHAHHEVTVEMDHDLIATADRGVFQRASQPDGGPKCALPGRFSLISDKPGNGCRVVNAEGDAVVASRIEIDTEASTLLFHTPEGTLNASQEPVDFSADRLVWNDHACLMLLQGNVVVDHPALGHLTADDQVKIKQQRVQGKSQLKSIETEGNTLLIRDEQGKETGQIVQCGGTVRLDDASKTIVLESSAGIDGAVAEEDQVHFHDAAGEIFADKVTIFYQRAKKEIATKKIVLEGHVRLLNQTAVTEGPDARLSQYALADTVEFFPESSECVLTALPGKRVLFYDKANDLEVSAPALKIKRDPVTKKDSIKGVGDVRFKFVEREFDQIRERFSLKPREATP